MLAGECPRCVEVGAGAKWREAQISQPPRQGRVNASSPSRNARKRRLKSEDATNDAFGLYQGINGQVCNT